MINGVESAEERVFALRTDPLRFEMFCRRGTDNLRLDWQAPRSICTDVFDKTLKAANGTLSEVADEPVVWAGLSPEVTTSTWDRLWAAMILSRISSPSSLFSLEASVPAATEVDA